ncbi:hypothetical protein CPB85DRAFT_1321777 [Mucidula mucida]|nr:hypothetical protein CPB85DRAFT_1321777 [Mucidula mucida]
MLHCEAKAVRADVAPVSKRLFWVTLTVDGTTRRFIIPAPKFHWGCLSPFSRSTLYVDNAPPSPTSRSGLFFMKDYWREPSTRTKPEADIYRLLAKHKVPNVAEMEVGGDEFLAFAHKLPNGRIYHHLRLPLQCHRIFLRTIARDLTAFGNCKTLLTCVADAMEAAQAAFTLARILHRDISVGNIMITSKDRGVLIDWDLCLVLDSNVVTHRPGRTGTWQFLSVHLLNGRLPRGGDAGKQSVTHSLVDDRESAFWVLLYIALLHLQHQSPPTDLYEKLIKWFDFNTVDDYHGDTGGYDKLNCLRGWADDVRTPVDFANPGLNALFTELAQVFMYRYRGFEDSNPKVERQKNVYVALARAYGPESQEALDTQYGQYVLGGQHMESASWLYDTLRRYAEDMPTPVQPAAAAVRNAERSACCAVPVIYDFVVNHFYPSFIATATRKRAKFREVAFTVSRLHGLGGHSIPSSHVSTPASQGSNHLALNLDDLDEDEDDEEEPQRKKVKTEI